MKILIDQNNLLVIENPNISKTKEYCHNLSWFQFCDYDKWLIVYHKNQFKIINLKDLWDKMWVIMVGETDQELKDVELDLASTENALKLFDAFDEESGEKYYFLYKFSENKLDRLNSNFKKIGSKISVKKNNKWFCFPKIDEELTYDPISFLFGLWLVYGDLNIKNQELKSIKIQIPLFWIFKEHQELIDEIVNTMLDNSIFVKTNITENSDGIIYEITSSDYELLEIFARFYQAIEKRVKITKLSELDKLKNELIEFLRNNQDIPVKWKLEILKSLEKWVIKILIKG